MLDYAAPLRDMRFVIGEIIGYEQISALDACEEVSAELVNAVLEEAGRFAAGVLAPLNRIGDTEGCRLDDKHVVHTPAGWRDAYAAFCDAGWNALAMNPDFGGQDLPKLVATAVGEMWDSANMAFGLCPLLTCGAIEAIEQHGDEALQTRYLAKLVSGEWTGTMNLTEPQAGSDLSAVGTRAVPEGDHYRITGQKIYITYGEHDLAENIIHLVLARTPDAPAGTRGISLFVVPKFLLDENGACAERNDVRCVSIEHKLGIHGSPTAVMSYGDDGGAIGYLVGDENRGLMYMFTMMNAARHAVGREGFAIGEAAYQLAVAYARERIQGQPPGASERAPIVEHADVKRMLMMMKSQVEAMRAVAYVCALAYDVGERHPDPEQRARAARRGDFLTPIVKGWSTETAQEIASLGVQVHGGMGFVEETGAAQYLRDVRITTIYEGTTGIQAGDLVGRKTLRDGGSAARELHDDMAATLARLEPVTGDAAAVRDAFASACAGWRAALDWLCESADDPRLGAAASYNFLMLSGVVCGGWMMAEAAGVAAAALEGAPDDAAFYRAKIAAARFYAAQILPRASGLRQAVVEGSSVIAEFDTAFV
ncbi:MAG: acyl-CoA dehydrogenase [Gammaproteobacteria bacterium]